MAVAEVTLHSTGASGDSDSNYESTYHVRCDDPLDGPYIVKEHFRTTPTLPHPEKNSIYEYGNDRDTLSVCKTLRSNRVPNSGGWFDVTVSFVSVTTEDIPNGKPGEGRTIDGKFTENPLLWHHEISVGFTQISAPVEQAVYIGGDKGSVALSKRKGKPSPVMNSAGVVFDPTIEEELDIKIIRITKNVRTYDSNAFDRFIGAVNSEAMTIDKAGYGFKVECSPFAAKIKAVTGDFAIDNGVQYFRRAVEIHINPRGWRRVLVDRGLCEDISKGFTDEATGTFISPGDLAEGATTIRRIRDADGFVISEPILLDGAGQRLKPGAEPVYLTYQTLHETSFAGASSLWD